MWFTCQHIKPFSISQIETASLCLCARAFVSDIGSVPFWCFYEFIFKYCACIGINFKASATWIFTVTGLESSYTLYIVYHDHFIYTWCYRIYLTIRATVTLESFQKMTTLHGNIRLMLKSDSILFKLKSFVLKQPKKIWSFDQWPSFLFHFVWYVWIDVLRIRGAHICLRSTQ